MNRTILKIIACLTMLIDHIGYLLFPQVMWLRWIGRLAMPLFAFFIAEGARYTSNKLRYFLQIFLLGVGCQLVDIIEQAVTGTVHSFYLNILITFSFSLVICYAYLYWEKTAEEGDGRKSTLAALLFLGTILVAVLFMAICEWVEYETYYTFTVDYGLRGILLPLAAVIAKDRKKKTLLFSVAIILYCLVTASLTDFVWFAVLDIPLLLLYNGEKGRSRFKYGFYLFYPLHLGVLYLLQMLL